MTVHGSLLAHAAKSRHKDTLLPIICAQILPGICMPQTGTPMDLFESHLQEWLQRQF